MLENWTPTISRPLYEFPMAFSRSFPTTRSPHRGELATRCAPGPAAPRLVAVRRARRGARSGARGAEGRGPRAELVDEGHLDGGPGKIMTWAVQPWSLCADT